MDRVFESDLIRRWNRANPKKALGPGVRLQDERIRSILAKSSVAVASSQKILEERVSDRIRHTMGMSAEARKKATVFAAEILENIAPIVLFVLIGSVGSEREELHDSVVGRIMEGIGREELADLSSLLGLELAAAAERSSLVRGLLKKSTAEKVREILGDSETRAALLSDGNHRGTTLVVSFPRGVHHDRRRLRFRITIYNDGADIKEERRLMEGFGDRGSEQLGERLLDRASASNRGIYGDDGLCFYYLGFLAERCGRRNISFDAYLREGERGGPVATTLNYGF